MPALRFGFTEKDAELIRESRFADPLGLQPVWSFFGRKLISNLTEQTKFASGFYLLACILYLYEQEYPKWVKADSDRRHIPAEQFYILAEQVFAYAVYHHQHKWDLPGANQLKNYYAGREDDTVTIGLNYQILGSQVAGGTWGLYRGAAGRSKILDDSERRLSALFLSDFKRRAMQLPDKQAKSLFLLIQNAYDSPEDGAFFFLSGTLSKQLSETLRLMGENKAVLYKYLIGAGTLREKVVRDYARTQWQNRVFLEHCRNKYSQDAYVFEDIIKCEDYIGTLESVLQFLYAYEGKTFKTTCNALPLSMNKVQHAYDQFMRVSTRPTGVVTGRRYNVLTRLFEADTKENFVRWLLRLHAAIAEDRGGTPWIEADAAGRIQVNMEHTASTELAVKPGAGWDNWYYLDSLLSVFKGLE